MRKKQNRPLLIFAKKSIFLYYKQTIKNKYSALTPNKKRPIFEDKTTPTARIKHTKD